MDVDVRIQLGLRGTSTSLNPISLDVGSIGSTASWAGSYHVLSMGNHYEDYILTGALMSLPPISGIPVAHPYQRLAGKIRAGGITGNIGEGVAALFATRYLKARINQIAHVKPRQPFKKSKSPDYLMQIGSLLPSVFSKIIPKGLSTTWPDWWPVKSKARNSKNASQSGRQDALKQLFAYWSLLRTTQPAAVGYGLIVVFKYQPSRQVRVNLIIPSNQTDLITSMKKGYDYTHGRNFLYDCGY